MFPFKVHKCQICSVVKYERYKNKPRINVAYYLYLKIEECKIIKTKHYRLKKCVLGLHIFVNRHLPSSTHPSNQCGSQESISLTTTEDNTATRWLICWQVLSSRPIVQNYSSYPVITMAGLMGSCRTELGLRTAGRVLSVWVDDSGQEQVEGWVWMRSEGNEKGRGEVHGRKREGNGQMCTQ